MDVFKIPILLLPDNSKSFHAKFSGETCIINFPRQVLKNKRLLVETADRIFWRLLQKSQTANLAKRVEKLNQFHFGFTYQRVRYHKQYRRWGSCSSLKNINISHRLIGAPEPLVDYVIIHELAHLKYLNHGKEFWHLISMTGVDPKVNRREITEYGRLWRENYLQWYRNLAKLSQSLNETPISENKRLFIFQRKLFKK